MPNNYELLRNPTALLVLRVWMERGATVPLRAYIRQTGDVSRGFEQTSTETDVDAAVASVRTWLNGVADARPAAGMPDVSTNGASTNGVSTNGNRPPTEDPAGGPDGGSADSSNGSGPGR